MPDTPAPPPAFPPFVNPWANLTQPELKKNSLRISLACEQALQRIYPKYGVIQTTISILLNKLLHELERNNINSYNPDGYAVAIAGASIVLGGTSQDVLGGTTAGDPGPPATTNNGVSGSTSQEPATRRKRTRTPKAPRGNE